MSATAYNFAYLDEQTKRMIRRAILKAIAIPGYQVPFASREMPMPYGWGTGGVQVTAAILGPDDVLKVIDQGSDDTTNAISIRKFFAKTAGVATTTSTEEASVIQTRHRIPEAPLHAGQVLVYQVPIPEPLRFLEPRETETRRMHALGEYGLMHVKLYEDIARFGHIATSYAYPVKVNARYVMDPSPTPKFDNPKMDDCPALQLFGAGREKRIYAIPPHTKVVSLDFEDHPFTRYRFDAPCALCGADDSYLDEIVTDDQGSRMFVCSDTDYCEGRQAAGHHGTESAQGEGAWLSTTHRSWWRKASEKTTGGWWPAATFHLRSIQAKCWLWSANPARASRRCCSYCPRNLRQPRAASPTACVTACCAIWLRSAKPNGASCSAPIGALCIRIPRRDCAWRSRPAPMSASR
jgi:alpha-D-ribose 1-methylphosphonate 5-phosphate C-P lyase